jgi:hypothetical protein
MSSSIKIEAKRVRNIIEATFPDNHKRSVYVNVGSVYLCGLNWSGGTKREYRACTIDGKAIENKYDMGAPAPWNNPFEGKRIDVPEGVAVVEGGYFCGKKSTLRITVNAANMPKLLPEWVKVS